MIIPTMTSSINDLKNNYNNPKDYKFKFPLEHFHGHIAQHVLDENY
jgi:hypothetical protein